MSFWYHRYMRTTTGITLSDGHLYKSLTTIHSVLLDDPGTLNPTLINAHVGLIDMPVPATGASLSAATAFSYDHLPSALHHLKAARLLTSG